MIIDLIIDRLDGAEYDSKEFYYSVMEYEENSDYPISKALDYGTNKDIQNELCNYIRNNEYNIELCDYINSVDWI